MGTRRIQVVVITLGFLFAANVFDPGGAFGFKYVATILVCLTCAWTFWYVDLSAREIALGLLFFVTWPVWALLNGVARNGDLADGLSQVTPFLFTLPLALVLPAVERRAPLRLFYACLVSLAVLVAISFGIVFLMPGSAVGSRVFEFLSSLQGREGYFGSMRVGDLTVPVFYFRSTLFLVPACVYFLFMDKVLRAGIVFLALALTWSKSGIVIALVFGLVSLVLKVSSRANLSHRGAERDRRFSVLKFVLPIILLSGITLLILASFPGFTDLIFDTAAGESETAVVREEHYRSIMVLFERNPDYLLTGQGVGTSFFSSGESDYVRIIEIAHLDAIRKFGLPWFVGFSWLVFYSAWRLIRSKDRESQGFGFALISMYIAGGTNPVLFSPLFIILLILCYFAQRPRFEPAGELTTSYLQRDSVSA